MIKELHIRNVALIDELNISFCEGFNVLSGETGAGKSIVVDSIGLILGSRADFDFIKTGQTQAWVEALVFFDPAVLGNTLEEYGIDAEDGEILLYRGLQKGGKSVCRINGRPVTVSILKSVAQRLIQLHGQNEHQVLFQPDAHLMLLDHFAGKEIGALKSKTAQAYREYREKEHAYEKIHTDEAEKQRRMDMLDFQIREIASANLRDGEEEELEQERALMSNAEKIVNHLKIVEQFFRRQDSPMDALGQAAKAAQEIAEYNEKFSKLQTSLNEAYYQLEDVSYSLDDLIESVYFNENRLEEIESRLAAIQALKRKYGSTIGEILSFLDEAERELEQLNHFDQTLLDMAQQAREAKENFFLQSEALSAERKRAAKRLQKEITAQLKDLGMEYAEFEVQFSNSAGNANGIDQVEFYLTVNKGEPIKPLSKVASGGEASRIMLALKTVAAATDDVGTLIFDEVDTGISGRIARVVAKKIAAISKHRQVICVTHLPQIAAMGDRNFLIEKSVNGTKTETNVISIEGDALIAEIARLSGGTAGEAAKTHAKELLKDACEEKGKI